MPQTYVRTKLEEVTDFLDNIPCRVFFKNELDQPSGSFKLRGIGHLILQKLQDKDDNRKIQVFSSSGGNAGLAAAYASRAYNVPCQVVLPKISKPDVVGKLEKLGATVKIHGDHFGLADKHLREDIIANTADDVQAVYVHPFDDPIIWDGHSTMIDEIAQQMLPEDLKKVRAVVCSVGGGGLYNGVVQGLNRNGLDNVSVLAIETHQTPTFSSAVEAGEVVHLPTVKTTTISLGSPYLAQKSFDNYKDGRTKVFMVDDKEADQAAEKYHQKFGRQVEASCGAALASVLDRNDLLQDLEDLQEDDIVIVVVCGGVVGI